MQTMSAQRECNSSKNYEGEVYYYHNDPAGHCTLGVGHLVHYGRCTNAEFERGKLSQRQIDIIMREDLAVVEKYMNEGLPPLSQTEYDALASLIFNIGWPRLSTSITMQYIERGEFEAVPLTFFQFVIADDLCFSGLALRRQAEAILWTYGRHYLLK